MRVWFDKKSKLCYVPINKNASSSYIQFFADQGWKEIDQTKVKRVKAYFGHIQDPSIRLYKGIAEIASLKPILLSKYSDVLLRVYHDNHVKSIVDQAGNIGVNWIPIDGEKSSEELTEEFLNKNGCKIKIPPFRKNVSDKRKKKIQERVKELYQINEGGSPLFHEIMKIYQRDVELWQEALNSKPKRISFWKRLFRTNK